MDVQQIEGWLRDRSWSPAKLSPSQRRKLEWALNEYLTTRQCLLLRLRLGLIDGKRWTLDEIATNFGFHTKQNADVLSRAALKRLSRGGRSRREIIDQAWRNEQS